MELWDVFDKDGKNTGKVVKRGSVIKKGNYHLVTIVLIKGTDGKFIISKRSVNKNGKGKWETTAGAAIAGEDSITAAIREVREEIGIELSPKNGKFIKRLKYEDKSSWFGDVWLFNEDVDLADVICQVEEVCGVKWATLDEITKIIDRGDFFNGTVYREIFDSSEFRMNL